MNKTFTVLCDCCGKEITVRYPPIDCIYYCENCEEIGEDYATTDS